MPPSACASLSDLSLFFDSDSARSKSRKALERKTSSSESDDEQPIENNDSEESELPVALGLAALGAASASAGASSSPSTSSTSSGSPASVLRATSSAAAASVSAPAPAALASLLGSASAKGSVIPAQTLQYYQCYLQSRLRETQQALLLQEQEVQRAALQQLHMQAAAAASAPTVPGSAGFAFPAAQLQAPQPLPQAAPLSAPPPPPPPPPPPTPPPAASATSEAAAPPGFELTGSTFDLFTTLPNDRSNPNSPVIALAPLTPLSPLAFMAPASPSPNSVFASSSAPVQESSSLNLSLLSLEAWERENPNGAPQRCLTPTLTPTAGALRSRSNSLNARPAALPSSSSSVSAASSGITATAAPSSSAAVAAAATSIVAPFTPPAASLQPPPSGAELGTVGPKREDLSSVSARLRELAATTQLVRAAVRGRERGEKSDRFDVLCCLMTCG